MKAKQNIIVLFILVLIASCGGRKYRYYTRINPDGSIFRRVIVPIEDSSDVEEDGVFPFDISKGWKITYDTEIKEKKDKPDTVNIAIAEKTFLNIDSMRICFKHDIDSIVRENVTYEMNRSFRWFYTYHTYKETYNQVFSIKHHLLNDYLTQEEQRIHWMEENDEEKDESLNTTSKEEMDSIKEEIDNKFGSYLNDNLLDEYFLMLDEYADSIGQERIGDKTKSIMFELVCNDTAGILEVDTISYLIDSIEKRDIAMNAYGIGKFISVDEVFEGDDRERGDNEDVFECKVEVSGVLYETNGVLIDDNIVMWEFTRDWYNYTNIEMIVKYRTTNRWSFIISAVIGIILVLILFLKRRST